MRKTLICFNLVLGFFSSNAHSKTLHCINNEGDKRYEVLVSFSESDETKVTSVEMNEIQLDRHEKGTYKFDANACKVCDNCGAPRFLREEISCSSANVEFILNEYPGETVYFQTRNRRGFMWHYDMNMRFAQQSIAGQAGAKINGYDYRD